MRDKVAARETYRTPFDLEVIRLSGRNFMRAGLPIIREVTP